MYILICIIEFSIHAKHNQTEYNCIDSLFAEQNYSPNIQNFDGETGDN